MTGISDVRGTVEALVAQIEQRALAEDRRGDEHCDIGDASHQCDVQNVAMAFHLALREGIRAAGYGAVELPKARTKYTATFMIFDPYKTTFDHTRV